MRDRHGQWTTLSLALGGVCALLLAASPAQAEWCGLTMEGTSNCGFSTKAQCMAGMSGLGGTCTEHGGAAKPAKEAPRRKAGEPKKKPAQ